MAVSDLIQQARNRFGQAPSVLLRANEPTGEKPWEMFVTDGQTEHYLALKTGGDSDKGIVTGALGGTVSIAMGLFSLFFAIKGEWDGVAVTLPFALICLLAPLSWEVSRPLPLPILFNRRTREVYFDHNGKLYHSP